MTIDSFNDSYIGIYNLLDKIKGTPLKSVYEENISLILISNRDLISTLCTALDPNCKKEEIDNNVDLCERTASNIRREILQGIFNYTLRCHSSIIVKFGLKKIQENFVQYEHYIDIFREFDALQANTSEDVQLRYIESKVDDLIAFNIALVEVVEIIVHQHNSKLSKKNYSRTSLIVAVIGTIITIIGVVIGIIGIL